MGPLPAAGQWTKLRVPAAFVGLAGRTVSGMALETYGGKVWFDRAGKTVGGTASLLRRKPNEPQYALLRNFGVDRFGRTLLAMWDFDNDSSLPMISNDAGSPLRRYSLYTPELNLLVETELTSSATPATQYEYVWFAGQPVAQFSGTTAYWTFHDHLGTPMLQTDSSDAVVWRAEYEPYGEVYKQRVASNTHQPLRFPGQEAEQLDAGQNGATDRRYNILRWYRAGWSRYTQADPLHSSAVSPYAYVDDNPLNWIDAWGLYSHRPGGPTHPSVPTRCRPEDPRHMLYQKIEEIERTIESHKRWIREHPEEVDVDHAGELDDWYNARNRCAALIRRNCSTRSDCKVCKKVAAPSAAVIAGYLIYKTIELCVAPELAPFTP